MEATSQLPAVARRPERILVVDDNSLNRMVATKILLKLGYDHVDLANNGREGVAAWEKSRHDLIIMDCHMPEMDGFDATRKIREIEAQEKLPQLPIVALTASAMAGDREACLAAGMSEYLTKPVDKRTLGQVLDRFLSEKAALAA